MDDLIAFLRARLDEDAHDAEAAGDSWYGYDPEQQIAFVSAADARHIARHSPARVLAEVDAKRRIMECHEPWTAGNGDIICGRCGREHIDGRPGSHFPCQTLRLLALPDAGHPDYREVWRP